MQHQQRETLARYVEHRMRVEGDSIRPGPWQLAEADPPDFLPHPLEIMRDNERMLKVGAPIFFAWL